MGNTLEKTGGMTQEKPRGIYRSMNHEKTREKTRGRHHGKTRENTHGNMSEQLHGRAQWEQSARWAFGGSCGGPNTFLHLVDGRSVTKRDGPTAGSK